MLIAVWVLNYLMFGWRICGFNWCLDVCNEGCLCVSFVLRILVICVGCI